MIDTFTRKMPWLASNWDALNETEFALLLKYTWNNYFAIIPRIPYRFFSHRSLTDKRQTHNCRTLHSNDHDRATTKPLFCVRCFRVINVKTFHRWIGCLFKTQHSLPITKLANSALLAFAAKSESFTKKMASITVFLHVQLICQHRPIDYRCQSNGWPTNSN